MHVTYVDGLVGHLGLDEKIYAPEEDFSAPRMCWDTSLHVVRCLLAAPKDEVALCRTSIFYTYIKHGNKSCKVTIDGDSPVNIIVKSVVEQMNLRAKPRPQPYNVTWVDKITHFVTQHCLKPIQLSSYHIAFGVTSYSWTLHIFC